MYVRRCRGVIRKTLNGAGPRLAPLAVCALLDSRAPESLETRPRRRSRCRVVVDGSGERRKPKRRPGPASRPVLVRTCGPAARSRSSHASAVIGCAVSST